MIVGATAILRTCPTPTSPEEEVPLFPAPPRVEAEEEEEEDEEGREEGAAG